MRDEGDVGSGVADRDPQFRIRGKLRIFRRRYIVGILVNKANISMYYDLSTDSKTRDLE